MQPLTNEEILRHYNLSGLAPDWYFKRSIDSSGIYHVEGASLNGQTYSTSDDNPDSALRDCVIQAGHWSGPIDTLTGLYNRKRFTSDLTVLLQNNTDIHLPLSIILMDMDYFKLINDQLGHVVGDQILARVGNMLTTIGNRHGVSLYRIGGDEFTVILSHKNKTKIQTLMEEIHNGMKCLELEDGLKMNNKPYTLTEGIATTVNGYINVEQMINRADKRMYINKRKRRGKSTIRPG